MQTYAIMPASRANGPGLRAVVWFQGCSLECPGCWNPETWDPGGGEDAWPNDVTERIVSGATTTGVQGVTFSGGEPMQQAYDLLWLINVLKLRRPNWTFGMFTGYTEQELEAGRYAITGRDVAESTLAHLWLRIRGVLDFAVMGRYDHTQRCSDGLISSRNQVLRLFSDRYALADFGQQLVEVQINESGLVSITGFPALGMPR